MITKVNVERMEIEEVSISQDKRSVQAGPKSFKERWRKVPDKGDKGAESDTNSESTKGATSVLPSICGTPLPERRGRGRPETTGDYRRLKELKRKRQEKDEKREYIEVVSPQVSPRSRSTSLSRTEADFVEEFKNSGSLEVAAAATEYANTVFKIAEKSKNLKGTFIKELKEAAAATTAAVETLAKRVQNPQASGVDEELDRRKELRGLKYENIKMKVIIARQQQEIRERDEFPLFRPPLAARDRALAMQNDERRERRELTLTETNTLIGAPFDREREERPEREDTETLDDPPAMHPSEKRRKKKINKREGRRNDEGSNGEEEETRFVVPPPLSPLPPPKTPWPSGRRKETQSSEIMSKLDWLMEEIVKIKKTLGEKKEEKRPLEKPPLQRKKEKEKTQSRNSAKSPAPAEARN